MNIMHKLTLKSLRMNKSRAVATLTGIILSMALITIVADVMVSLKASEENYFEKHYGNYDIAFTGRMTDNNVKKLAANRDVKGVYLMQDIGVAQFEASESWFRNSIVVTAFSKNAFGEVFDSSLSDGRYPENPDEVVLSETFITYTEKKYNVGDTITLSIGTDGSSHSDDESSKYDEYEADKDEEFEAIFTKTYKICGILNREPLAYSGNTVNIYTYTDFTDKIQTAYKDRQSYTNEVFIKLHDGGRANTRKFFAELLNLDLEESEKNKSDLITDEEFYGKLSQSEFHISYAQINGDLYDNISVVMNIIFYVGLVLIMLIMTASVFIIKNGFLISLTEKTVLYGKISSIGATARQVANSMFFEGFVLGIIGIPVGLLLGIGGTSAALGISSELLYDLLDGAELILKVSWLSLIPAVILGGLTIFFSSLFAVVRAYRISPIEAIRSNKDIRMGMKKKNSLKSPAWVVELFGAGGKIAWKNMKRSSRRYRTVVISIVVSISVFIGLFSFVNYMTYNMEKIYGSKNYNMSIENYNKPHDYNPTINEKEKIFCDIAEFEEIKEYCYTFKSRYYCFDLPINKIPSEYKNADFCSVFTSDDIWGNMIHNIETQIVAYDDNTYNTILDRLGYSYDNMKDRAILVNINRSYAFGAENEIKTDRLIVDPIGYKIRLKFDEMYQNEEYTSGKNEEFEMEIGGEITNASIFNDTLFSEQNDEMNNGSLIVSMNWVRNNNYYGKDDLYGLMYIMSDDPDRTEKNMNIYRDNLNVSNNYTREKQINSVSALVRILTYGFLCAISLIGITNIFNTINTNTKLRQKEYAMLRSVGMTRHEFNRMTVLECMFYTVGALIIGILIGIICTVIIHFCFLGIWETEIKGDLIFMFPWSAIVISIFAVTVLVVLISVFSVSRIHNQNIAETIRNDNI